MNWLFRRPLCRSVRLLWAAILVLMLGGLVGGCGQGSFVGRQYDNFTAYYNTFYNATNAFEKGVESVSPAAPEVDRTRYLSIFPEPQASSGGESFKKAIQKSADLLREHPNSKWVDDALLLIGKSYYYQQNYVGALQKFREVIALDAEREGEARFWLTRTLVVTGRYSEAADALRAGLESEEDYGPWTARMRLVQGELLVRQEEWEAAEEALEQGLKGSVPDDVGARATLLLGQVHETREDFEEAAAAYRRVADYNPKYRLEFAARLSAIEMQGLYGNPAVALKRLESLERGDDTKRMRGEIALVRARLYEAQGRTEEAKEVLTTTLWGDEAPAGETEGRIHHELGTLYRDAYEDFTRAAAHFDTASTSLSSPSGQGQSGTDRQAQALPRAPSDAEAQAERFRNLAKRAQAVARMDSLLRIGRMPPSEFQSFVEELREKRRKELKAQARERRQQQFQSQGPAVGRDRSEQSPNIAVETRESDAGFLFHRDPTLVQQGRRQFRQTWGDRLLVDNWRRLNAIQGSNSTADAEGAGQGGSGPAPLGGEESSGPSLDLSAIPRDSASQAEMEDERAVARYELANSLFRAAARPDSAETWYRRVLEENGDHPVARQALYALAQAHRAQGDTTAAREAYHRVIEKYPGTSFAKRARQQLGLDPVERAPDLSESKADSAYARAYETWRGGRPDTAFVAFLEVAEEYPNAAAAPRALLAAGVVYHRILQRDTLMQRDTVAQRDTVKQRDSVAQRDTVAERDPLMRRDTVGQRETGRDLRARLRRFLDRLAPDSVATDSSVATTDTVATQASAPAPGSAAVDASAKPNASPGPPVQQGADTTESAPQSEGEPDTTAGVPTPPKASPPDTVRDSTAPPVSQGQAGDSTGTAESNPKPSPPQTGATDDSTEAPSADTTGAQREERADTTLVEGGGAERTDPTVAGPEGGTDTTSATAVEEKGETDSTGVPQKTIPDSVQATPGPDSVQATSMPDTAQASPSPDSVQATPKSDSTQAAPKKDRPTDPLKALLTHLTEQYGDTPQAKQARSLLQHLEQQAAPDSTAADSAAVASAGAEPSSDSTVAAPAPDPTATPDSLAADTASGPPEAPTDTTSLDEEPSQTVKPDSAAAGSDETEPPSDSAMDPPTPDSTTTIPDSLAADTASVPREAPADTASSDEEQSQVPKNDSTAAPPRDSTSTSTEPAPTPSTDSSGGGGTLLVEIFGNESASSCGVPGALRASIFSKRDPRHVPA